MKQLLVGFGRELITPAVPVHMAGYGWRFATSIGVHDDLYVKAIAFSDGAHTVLLLAFDLVSFDLESDKEIKGAVSAATGLPVDAIITNTSHTHAGPMVVRSAYQPFEPAYFGTMLHCTTRAALTALADLSTAALSVGSASVLIGRNRRKVVAQGDVAMVPNPEGQSLPEVDIWHLQRANGDDIVLWSTPIHGVTMTDANLLISAEWMGAAVRDLEANQPGLKAVFLQGCCGDQNPFRDTITFEQVDILGRRAADSVRTALRSAQPIQALPLETRLVQVALPVDQAKLPPEPPLIPDGPRPPRPPRDHRNLPLRGLRLGDALMVGMAGEPFVEYAFYGRSVSPAASIMVLGYTDATINYLPTAQAYVEGGYEPGAWIWYPDGAPWLPELEGILKQDIKAMVDDLWAQPQ
ncbi:MAG: neutral/alkaline non-lysosomal ceramidase N-terminal domain-containing protein [Anaerolineae bacterium]